MVAIILSMAAVVMGIVAIIIAVRNKRETVREVVVKKEVVHAPVEHPFIYDEESGAYRLEGGLYVDGSITALSVENKKKEEKV